MKNSSHLPAYEDGKVSVPKCQHIRFRRQGITQKKAYNIPEIIFSRTNLDKFVDYFMDVKQSFTLRDHRPGVFGNGTARKMFGLEREGVIGEWRKLQSEELHYLVDHLKNKIGGSCGSNGGAEKCTQSFGGET
jgi:hypothetical protein